MNELKCPHCQAENREGVKFCRKCGKSFTTELKCPNCNHINLEDSDFCEECGHSLVETASTSSQPDEPTKPTHIEPTSFVNDRYQVIRKLGEGGKKKVYLSTTRNSTETLPLLLSRPKTSTKKDENALPVKPRLWVNWVTIPT